MKKNVWVKKHIFEDPNEKMVGPTQKYVQTFFV